MKLSGQLNARGTIWTGDCVGPKFGLDWHWFNHWEFVTVPFVLLVVTTAISTLQLTVLICSFIVLSLLEQTTDHYEVTWHNVRFWVFFFPDERIGQKINGQDMHNFLIFVVLFVCLFERHNDVSTNTHNKTVWRINSTTVLSCIHVDCLKGNNLFKQKQNTVGFKLSQGWHLT